MAADADPVILEVALDGATPRAQNPHVPRTPAEITRDALACLDSGAAIVHNHHDDPMFIADGVHPVEPYVEAWEPVVAARPDGRPPRPRRDDGAIVKRAAAHRAGARCLRGAPRAQWPALVGGGAGRRRGRLRAGPARAGAGRARARRGHAGARRPSNLELLEEATSLLGSLGRRPATCAEAREMLGVPAW
jgi:hypothetical protein